MVIAKFYNEAFFLNKIPEINGERQYDTNVAFITSCLRTTIKIGTFSTLPAADVNII